MAKFLKLLHQTKDDPEIKDKFHIYLCDEADATLWNVVMPSVSFLEMAPDIFHGLEQNALLFHRAAQETSETGNKVSFAVSFRSTIRKSNIATI